MLIELQNWRVLITSLRRCRRHATRENFYGNRRVEKLFNHSVNFCRYTWCSENEEKKTRKLISSLYQVISQANDIPGRLNLVRA